MELLPLAMLYVSRALTISFKYSYLPDTYVNDKDGIMYTENFTAMTLSRQLVATAWIAPNKEGNTDMLMQEIEAASIVADVNLRGVRAEMGSKEAVAAVEAAAAGVGVAEGPRERPTTVSGVTLLAAIVDEAFGREIPVQWIVADFAGAVGLAFCQPICRAAVGVPAFGSSALGTAVCLAMSFAMWMMNFLNFGFLIFIFWDFRRRCAAVEALGDLVTHPGWSPEARHATGGERASKSDNPSAVHAAGGAPRAPAAVTLDLKHPDSCLCWLLVRRTLRQIGHIWGRRMNMYSVVFMVVALTCAAVLQVFFYGQLAFSHRFSSAVSLLYLVLVVSGLTVLVVLEASRLNDFSPAHRTLLRREAFAVAAQIANAPPARGGVPAGVTRDPEGGGGPRPPRGGGGGARGCLRQHTGEQRRDKRHGGRAAQHAARRLPALPHAGPRARVRLQRRERRVHQRLVRVVVGNIHVPTRAPLRRNDPNQAA